MSNNSLEQEIKQFHGHPLFLEVLEELKELHSQKNKQYATKGDPLGNFRRCSTAKQKLFDRGFRDDLYRRMTAYALLLASKQEDGACEIVGECKEGTVDSLYEKLRDVVVYYAICMVFEKLRDQELKKNADKPYMEPCCDGKHSQESEDTGCCANSDTIKRGTITPSMEKLLDEIFENLKDK